MSAGHVQAVRHLMQRSLSLAFHSWQGAASEMREEGDNLVLAVTRWQHSYLSSAFNAWVDWLEDRRDR